jgi:EmrB/QacA subfamily drug resistance transporter
MSAPSAAPAAPSRGLDRALVPIAAVVVLGAIMSILDTTIVNVAINHLAQDFDASLSTIQWVATGYLLALATVIPLTGWAADRFGTKRLYITSLVLFVIGSAASGAAWSAESLIFFRVLQGLGGGMIMPAGMTILTQAAGTDRVGRVMSIVGVPMLMGPIIGPVLGGWLVDDVSWRWIFYVNIPIGFLAVLAASRFLPRDVAQPAKRLDWMGLLMLSPGVAFLVYGLAESSSDGGFGSTKVWLTIAVGLVLIAGFVVHALRTDDALIDLKLFRHRTFAAAAGTSFLFATAFFGAMLLLPLYYQVVRGESALDAGLLLIPQGAGAALMMPIAGSFTDKTGAGRIVLVGLVFIVGGMFGFSQVGDTTPYVELCSFSFLIGLGMGATMMPSMSAAYQTLDHAAVPRATTALNIIQRVGGSIGIAVLSVVLAGRIGDAVPQAGGGGSLGRLEQIPAGARDRILPAIADAFGHTYAWALIIVALALIPALLLPRHLARRSAPADGREPAAAVAFE